MSTTPRTDELSRQIEGYAYVPSTFARKLERELGHLEKLCLSAQQIAIDRGNKLLEIQAAAINALDLFACPKRGWSGCFCPHCTLRRSVAAASSK